jgi:hypothetical protein
VTLEIVEFCFADETPDPDFTELMWNLVEFSREYWRDQGTLDQTDPVFTFKRVISDEVWPGVKRSLAGGASDAYTALINGQNQTNQVLQANGYGATAPRGTTRVIVPTMNSHPALEVVPTALGAPWYIVGEDDSYRRWYRPTDSGMVTLAGGRQWAQLRRVKTGPPWSMLKPLLRTGQLLAHEFGHAAGLAHHNNTNSPPQFTGIDCRIGLYMMCANGQKRQNWGPGDSEIWPHSPNFMRESSWIETDNAGPIHGDPRNAAYGRELLPVPPSVDQTIEEFHRQSPTEPPPDPGGPPVGAVLTINRAPYDAFDGTEAQVGDRIIVDFEPIAQGEQAVILAYDPQRVIGGKGITHDSEQKIIVVDESMVGNVNEITAIVIRGANVEPWRVVEFTVAADVDPPVVVPPVAGEPTIDGDPWSEAEGRTVIGAVTLDFGPLPRNTRVAFTAAAAGVSIPLNLGLITTDEPDPVRWNTDTDDLPDGATIITCTHLFEDPPEPPFAESFQLRLTVDNTGEPPVEPGPPVDSDVLRTGVDYVQHTRFEEAP